MALITSEWLAADAVNDTNFKLTNNNYMKSRNAADDGDVNIVKVNASDVIEFASVPQVTADPSAANDLVRKSYLAAYQLLSEKNASNGYCPLDAGGKVPAANLAASVMNFLGAWNANTNSPSLADGTGDAGDIYRASVAGTSDLGSGSLTFGVGDWVMYNGSIWQRSPATDAVTSVNSLTGAVSLTADTIPESGSPTNKYFTNARAIASTLTGYTSGAGTISSADSILSAIQKLNGNIAAFSGADAEFEVFTISGTDVTNQYTDLAQVAMADSILVSPKGGPVQYPGDDYTVSYTGGAGSKTRVSWAGDLAANLSSGDKLMIKYLRA